MHPYLIQWDLPGGLGTFRLPSYGTMIALGFLVCLYLLQRRARRTGLDPLALFDAVVWALMGGLVGARLFYVLHHWHQFAPDPLRVFALWHGGLTFYGGVIGGALGLLVQLRRKGLPLRPTLDVCASLLPLGHAFGRVGCFLNGCCYGEVTDCWVGVRFPRIVDGAGEIVGSLAYLDHLRRGLVTASQERSLPVHPTQLYEVALELAIFALLGYWLTRRRRAGDVAWAYPVLYGAGRFVYEFFRGDTEPIPALGGLTLFQVVSIGLVAFGVAMLARSRTLPPEPVAEPYEASEQ